MDGTEDDTGGIKDLREAAERGRKATQELEEMRREVAFLKAGVDLDSKAGQLLLKAYDGELDKDAIRAEADEIGALTSGFTPVEDTGSDEQASEERAALANEAVPPEATTENPYDQGHKEYREMVAAGRPTEDAAATFVRTVIDAAGAGDERVIAN